MMKCPVCGSRSFVRTSEELTPTVRQLYYYCGNIACSMTWKSMLSIVAVISPSGISPEFRLPHIEETKPPGHEYGQMSLLDLCRDGGDDPPA
ncbi:MAG: hypothetical protein BGP16_12805 [Sphingobium sp. 66-54]|nr:MAG: hypothetical protein BGP16_12805 [Sphingobium sp. 66-54]